MNGIATWRSPCPARRERSDLQQAQPDAVAPLLVALERAPALQVPGEPERGADRDAAATAQLGQAQPTPTGVERREQRERTVDYRLALRRTLAPGRGARDRLPLAGMLTRCLWSALPRQDH
jgi:hypothetical protein